MVGSIMQEEQVQCNIHNIMLPNTLFPFFFITDRGGSRTGFIHVQLNSLISRDDVGQIIISHGR